jgi:hypothetical protein
MRASPAPEDFEHQPMVDLHEALEVEDEAEPEAGPADPEQDKPAEPGTAA